MKKGTIISTVFDGTCYQVKVKLDTGEILSFSNASELVDKICGCACYIGNIETIRDTIEYKMSCLIMLPMRHDSELDCVITDVDFLKRNRN